MELGRQGGTMEFEVKGVSAAMVWSFLDFTTVDKVAPDMESCTIVDGIAGKPGCTKCSVLKPIPGLEVGPDGKPFLPFLKKKLRAIDHEELSYSYEVTESNIGLIGYVAHVKVVDNGGGDSTIQWSFEVESFGDWSRDGLSEFLRNYVQGIVKTMERAVKEGEA